MKNQIFLLCGLISISAATPLKEIHSDQFSGRATGDVKFYLYTQSNPSTYQELFIGNEDSVNNSSFDIQKYTKILIHGWTGSYASTPNPELRAAYLFKGNYNIIVIDWSKYAQLNYVDARQKVPTVGGNCAEFVDFMHNITNLNLDELVVIGHSLGAHVAGYCGKLMKAGKLGAIVGLDPALPLFLYIDSTTRLADTDAKTVETIQTAGGTLGFHEPIGTTSFYPNWGANQPGCNFDVTHSCSHGRSVSYYSEGVIGYSFQPIYKCPNYYNVILKIGCSTVVDTAKIGDPLEIAQINGLFYFATNSEAPFGHY